jgi:hypothetical protein
MGDYGLCLQPASRVITLYAQDVLTSTAMTTTEAHDEQHAHIPGTVHIVDLEGTMRGRHARGVMKDIVLVPAPSNDPDDPLNCMCPFN